MHEYLLRITRALPGHAERQLENQTEIGQRCQELQERVLQVRKQQAETEEKYWPAVKQER